MPNMMPNAMGPNAMPNMMPNAMPNMMPMMMGKNAPMVGAQASPPMVPSGSFINSQGGNIVAVPVAEESYVENILRLNRGKMASFYMTYENNREWNAKIFRGIIEAAGRDHIIISDPSTGMRYLLLMLNLDYVTFDGPIQYEYPFEGGVVTNTTPMNNREEEI
ncbi:spore coat protein GerQ [Paenibacillus radicis (ex Gao et al. 2016)]